MMGKPHADTFPFTWAKMGGRSEQNQGSKLTMTRQVLTIRLVTTAKEAVIQGTLPPLSIHSTSIAGPPAQLLNRHKID